MADAVPALPLRAAHNATLLYAARKTAQRLKLGLAALCLITAASAAAIFAPIVAPIDPLEQDYNSLLSPPSVKHPMGTDQVGRDLFSRIVYGTRISLVVGLSSVGVAIIIGLPLGLLAGYLRGLTDELLMRLMDGMMAFPSLILALAIVTVLKPSAFNVMLAIGLTSAPVYARLVRSQALSLSGSEFVTAARSIGASDTRVMARHILPNLLAPVIVQATFGLGSAVLAEASLGYIGVGVQPPTPTWGAALNQGAPLLEQAPWLSFFPGLAIFTLVLAFNLLGDALRDLLDPRLHGR